MPSSCSDRFSCVQWSQKKVEFGFSFSDCVQVLSLLSRSPMVIDGGCQPAHILGKLKAGGCVLQTCCNILSCGFRDVILPLLAAKGAAWVGDCYLYLMLCWRFGFLNSGSFYSLLGNTWELQQRGHLLLHCLENFSSGNFPRV